MPTKNVVITEHQAEFVEKLVASGRYQNASEVLREGLRLIERQSAEEKARLKALREAAHVGIADIEAKRYRSFNSADSLKHHFATIIDAAISEKVAKRASR